MNNHSDVPTITRHLVPADQRLTITAELFGTHFPLRIEPVIYGQTEKMTRGQYRGGYWEFYTLDNCGFYMAPAEEQTYQVSCDNYWQGILSSDGIGIVCTLYAYNHLSFSKDLPFARVCANHYHRLREYMYGHRDVGAID